MKVRLCKKKTLLLLMSISCVFRFLEGDYEAHQTNLLFHEWYEDNIDMKSVLQNDLL